MKRRKFINRLSFGAAVTLMIPKAWSRPIQLAALPNVLILGDSISIGYTDLVRQALDGKANVYRPMQADGKPWNCGGTTAGVKHLDTWLAIQTKWDVIHFNFGLHDLKHVDANNGKNSTNPNDPQQAKPSVYKKQLKEIAKKLKSTNAQCIFANTTPFPDKPKGPLRRADQAEVYNRIAFKIMKKYDIPINDLNAFVQPNMEEWQFPNNVHFRPAGSRKLAEKVAQEIEKYL
ncbi:MAG: SGNH/GDSL hydrolase family protein [Bacteroidota bacterium]